MSNEELLRPRWGTFSVIDHKSPSALIPEILLYDRLVFPVPTEADRPRWVANGWAPDLLDVRLKELNGLVHPMSWTEALREEWKLRWEQLKKVGLETQKLAFGLTPMVLAQSAW